MSEETEAPAILWDRVVNKLNQGYEGVGYFLLFDFFSSFPFDKKG
jgi:hypothetical protein